MTPVQGQGMACTGTFYRTLHDRMRNSWEQSLIFNAGHESRVQAKNAVLLYAESGKYTASAVLKCVQIVMRRLPVSIQRRVSKRVRGGIATFIVK
jgi:hypothetical protein